MVTPAPWPIAALDVPALRAAGRRAVPLRQFVLKVHSRCNLACSYCYIYQGADTSWRRRPARADASTMRQTALRIAEHVRRHHLQEIRVDLHGGEPLMAGPGPVLDYAAAVRSALPATCAVAVTVQTNGTRLTASVLADLADAGIRIGISLDGGTAALNARRADHAGRPSWPAVSRAARLLARHPASYAGLLCTVDIATNPAEVYRSLTALLPPRLDLLLPHANWTNPPPGLPSRTAPYGRWLATAFDLWWDDRSAGAPRIRLFTEIIALLLGMESTTESIGLSPTAALVVDTDGAIEQVDSLKTAYEQAPATGLDVFRHTFDDALDHPGVASRQLGLDGLAATCRGCPVVRVCGGGNYTHRYRHGSGFRHPSVYCHDLEHLIRHIARRLSTELDAIAWAGGQ
ncbi:FxsB family radical SAM/SPASM domain protein [Streptomyces sp. RB6PN25]|uniref:FxsB family radical SAM/SPASM domain protein n=1 Tax=Streptomyces humicola TaxID=2953240 RepID=A0ABT1PRP3_9ACTN|nr:FxsB family cyclophane-forming radical SAM/SPASM peptide maturase [Streptomyces humicola]MCQ4080336.1 FxsB family radical SAM/SPASM domain protein [Streptomyces humicola]